MLKTLDRYVIREVVPPFVLSLLIFTFILELPPVMEELEKLVAKGVPWQTAGYIIVLLSPQALGLTIPMALLVGLLIGLGRMSSDREAVALLACGVSPYRLLRPVMLLAAVATAATMYVMIEAIPDSNQAYRQILFEILTKKVEGEIKPGVFYEEFPSLALYPQQEAAPGQAGWKNLLVANSSRPETIELILSKAGQIVLDPATRTVRLILNDGVTYSTSGNGEARSQTFKEHIVNMDPDSVFRPLELPRGVTEKTIDKLRIDIATKEKNNLSPHNEIMAIHAKFSIPAACIVFALIALALGLTVARDGKLGGFVVGIGVIFAYYVAMFLAESMAKGHRIPAEWARWVPNILLGPFGILALVLRARHAEGRLPFGLKLSMQSLPAWLRRRTASADAAAPTETRKAPIQAARTRRGVVVVVRLPRIYAPMPGPDRPLHQPALSPGRGTFLPRAARPVLHLDVHRSLGQDFQGRGERRDDRSAADLVDAAVRLLRDSHRRAAERARDLRAAVAHERADRHEGLRHQPVPIGALGPGPVARLQRDPVHARAARHGEREQARRGSRRPDQGPPAAHAQHAEPPLGQEGQRLLSLRRVRPGRQGDDGLDGVHDEAGLLAARDADVRQARRLQRHGLGRRAGMDAELRDQSTHVDADREEAASRAGAARVLRQGTAGRRVHDGERAAAVHQGTGSQRLQRHAAVSGASTEARVSRS